MTKTKRSNRKKEINIGEMEEAYKNNPLWNIWKEAGMSLSDMSKTLDINYVTLRDSLYKIQRPALLMEKFQTANLIEQSNVEKLMEEQSAWVINNKNILFYDVMPLTPAVCKSREPRKRKENNNGKTTSNHNGNGKINGNLSAIKSMAYGTLSAFYQGMKESYSTVVDYNDTNIFHAANEIKRVDPDVDVIIETRLIVKRRGDEHDAYPFEGQKRDHKIF